LHEEMLRISIDNLGYDLLLMDIDLIKEVNERYDLPVIYVTSFADGDTFQEAKKTHPSAYVVKPYKEIELQRAIELAIGNKQNNAGSFTGWQNDGVLNNCIYIKEEKSLVKVELKSIQLIEAYDKYCFLYTADKKHMIRSRLRDILAQLPDSLFCQVHRSYIINTEAIEEIGLADGKVHVADSAMGALTGKAEEGKEYILTGPESISMHDVAASFTRELGKEVNYVAVPHAASKDSMMGMGFPEFIVDGYVELSKGFSAGIADTTTGHVEALSGHPARSIDNFTQDFKSYFGA